jgi:hypothetical protein
VLTVAEASAASQSGARAAGCAARRRRAREAHYYVPARKRLRAAVLRRPAKGREQHLLALAMLLHLIDHLPEGREPVAYVAFARAYQIGALRWAAAQLERGWIGCTATDCTDPDHVTLIDQPVEVAEG